MPQVQARSSVQLFCWTTCKAIAVILFREATLLGPTSSDKKIGLVGHLPTVVIWLEANGASFKRLQTMAEQQWFPLRCTSTPCTNQSQLVVSFPKLFDTAIAHISCHKIINHAHVSSRIRLTYSSYLDAIANTFCVRNQSFIFIFFRSSSNKLSQMLSQNNSIRPQTRCLICGHHFAYVV